jgi:hypothetical protein
MHAASEVDENTLLDNMFDCGKYSWLKDTARVTRAVQARYNGKTRAKAFTALFQLCEIKCGAYLAESCFDEEYKTAKLVYVEMQKDPDKPCSKEDSEEDSDEDLSYSEMDIVEAFDIFGDKKKALQLCLARFDEDTQETFLNLYDKVDGDTDFNAEESTDTSAEGNKCPF